MFVYDFRLEAGDLNAGTVYLPDDNTSGAPVIIYCHGWGGKRQLSATTRVLCDKAIEAGIALVTFDFYARGDTGGDFRSMTYERWKNNLSDVVTWVSSQPFSDIERIGCYAFSSGSTAAFRVAAEDERIAFIISVGTCVSAHFAMERGGPAKLLADNLDKLTSGGTVKIYGTRFGIDFFIDTISNAPINLMHKIKCPVLFLQGAADNTFRCSDAKNAYDLLAMRNPNNGTAYIPLEGGTHALDNMADEAMAKAIGWLTAIIK